MLLRRHSFRPEASRPCPPASIGHDGSREDCRGHAKEQHRQGRRGPALRHHRPLGRARGGAARQGIRPCRPLAGRDRRADEGARPVRRHRQPGVRRPRPAGAHLCRDRHEGLLGVDGDHRHLQLPPDAGAGHREVRHRAAAPPLAAQARLGRGEGRPGADRARRRHRPAGDPADGAARGRPLCAERHQDLDLQRHRGLLLRASGEDQPGGLAALLGHEPVHRPQGPGLPRRPQAREARLQVDQFGRADLRGLPASRPIT